MRLALVAVFAVLAVGAAGCGGSDEGQDATAAWADGLCSALDDWTTAVQAAGDTLRDTTTLSPDSVEGAIQGVVDATATLSDDVQALGKPELDAADEAEATVTELADTLQDGANTLQQTLDDSSGGVEGVLGSISTITATLGSMANAVGQAFSELQGLDAQGELEQALEDADSCAALTG